MKTFLRRSLVAIATILMVAAPRVAHAAPPQSVTIVTPPNGAQIIVAPGSPVTITANATSSGGSATISSIDFRVDGVSIGSVAGGSSSVSLSTTWQPPAVGTYTITAVASDSSSASGNTATSNPSIVSVTSVAAPATSVRFVGINTPASGAVIARNSQLFVRANASISNGLVKNVRFILRHATNPDVDLGTVSAAPYSLPVTSLFDQPPDSYSLLAEMTDSNDVLVATSTAVPVTIVTAIGSPPNATITAPTATDTVTASTNVTVAATASDDGTVASVTFFADGEQIGTTDTSAPYSVTWTPTQAKSYALRAQVVDNNNNVRLSASVPVTVGVATPTVTITAPTAGQTVSVGGNVTVTATATAGSGLAISNVQFFANGASIGNPDSQAPYSITWTPTTPGLVILTARATDSVNGITLSAPVTVNVTGATNAPTVTIAMPAGTSVPAGSTRIVTATTTPATGIDRVELLFNESVIATDTVAPYTFLLTAPNVLGPHLLQARVVDSTGLSGVSAITTVTVTGATGVPPSVGILSPTANAFLAPSTATTISGTAVDSDGSISSVQVFANDTLVGSATLAGGSWSIAWTTPATPGVVSLTAIANDNSGNAVASPALGVNIADASSPAIVLGISPVVSGQPASTTFPSGATKNFVANVTAAAGRAVVRVEFFIDGTKVGEDTASPFTFRYVAPPLNSGEQSRVQVFGARATDNAGAARDVQVPLLVVSPIGLAPNVSLLTPTNNASVAPGTALSLAATAIANGGSIASVQFYVNGSPAPVNSGNAIIAAPYTSTFTPTAPGTYTIDAIATDDRGNTTVSNSATITAAFTTPTVAITTPNPNTTARATPNVPLNLAATATVQAGAGASILLVEFLLDGVQIGADTTAPYTFSWTPNISQLGPHVLTARVTDTNSQTATSAPVNVNVANIIGTPPTVTITTQPIPPQGLQTLSQVNFIANAAVSATGVTITNVEFFLNDVSIGTATREQATNLYRVAYDFSRFDFSTAPSITDPNTGVTRYTPIPLYAIARDSNNNQTVSAVQNLTVFPSTSTPPVIQQLVPLSPTILTQGQQFLIGTVFNDTDGTVTQLQLYANGTLHTTLNSPQPNPILTYNATQAGRFNLYVVAIDDTGNSFISSPSILVTVNAVVAPTTTITRPSDDETVTTVGAPVFLEGTATSADTTQVPTLQFIAIASGGARTTINATRVGTTTTYRAIWVPTTPGTFAVSTQANIGATASGTSTLSRQVVVTNLQGLAPSVTLNVPASTTTASSVNFTANATDSDGSVVGVEFFVNRNSIGQAVRDQLANTWRLTASFAGVPPGTAEVVALVRDSSGNVAASPTSNVTVTAASSIAPSVAITPSTTNAAFNRQVQLRSNARDTDGNVNSVQYFANNTNLGTSTNAGTNYQVNWTPTTSGVFNIWAVATDNTNNTTVASTVQVTVRRNNPVIEDAAFILQTYQDIANTTNVNPLVFDDLDARLGDGSLSRADLVVSLIDEPGFLPPVQLLAAYYVLMGQWPTPANYNALIGTARGNLGNAIGNILSSNEYFAKYGVVPTVALLNNPSSAIPADTFITRLWQGAGLGSPTALQNTQFRSNNVLTATLGRGYGPVGLNQALSEFITNTNSNNTTLYNRARAAALYYQLNRPPVTVTVDQITARVAELVALNDPKAIADAALKDILYNYRYVTITRHPQSLTLAARSGALFSVEAQGSPPLAYQWLLNGAPIVGATNSLLSLTNVDATRVGTYTVVVTSSAGTATSDPATLTLTGTPTRLANISTRGVTSGGANVLIGGFIVSGANAQQTRQVLIRVVGPTLAGAPFNVTGVLANPRLEVYSGNNPNPVLTNDDWGTQAGGAAQVTAIQQAINRAAAFAFAGPNSADAAVLATLPPGPYTVQAKGPANNPDASGVVLIEVYDVTANATAPGRAANVSTRGNVGTGTNVLIAGFVVNGAATRRVLIRGAGPTLANLGVPGVLADPQLTLIEQSSGRTIRTNNDWATGDDAAVIAQAATAAGAFPFANGSRDAAMIVMLPPGAYTVQLSGVNNGTGVGIVEVYDVDP